MKIKLCSIMILCFLISIMVIPVFATGTDTYKLDELDMSISMPSDYVVFTRDIDANDPNLGLYGLTKDDLSSLLTSRKIYLNAWDQDINFEILVTMDDSPLEDFNLFGDTALSIIATSFDAEYEEYGMTIIKTEIYQHSQAKFLKTYVNMPDESGMVYGLQYYTVYANKAINITMRSYSGKLDTIKENTIQGIVDSAKFGTEPHVATSTAIPTEPFQYTDPKTGVSFTVPSNWSEKPIGEDLKDFDAKFALNNDEIMCIYYNNIDLWAAMTPSEKIRFSRADIDNFYFQNIADIYGMDNAWKVTYNDHDFYCVEFTNTDNSFGVNLSVTTTQMGYVKDGYLYIFQFVGVSDNPYYKDFEALLSSVKFFKTFIDNGSRDNSYIGIEQSSYDRSLMNRYNFGNIILSLIITISIYSLPIIIYRYAIREYAVEPRKAKRITIIYGIVAFIIMTLLVLAVNGDGAANGAIILWSYINYRILTSGKKRSDVEAASALIDCSATQIEDGADKPNDDLNIQDAKYENNAFKNENTEYQEKSDSLPRPTYCRKCGNKLQPDSLFCDKCGTEIF